MKRRSSLAALLLGVIPVCTPLVLTSCFVPSRVRQLEIDSDFRSIDEVVQPNIERKARFLVDRMLWWHKPGWGYEWGYESGTESDSLNCDKRFCTIYLLSGDDGAPIFLDGVDYTNYNLTVHQPSEGGEYTLMINISDGYRHSYRSDILLVDIGIDGICDAGSQLISGRSAEWVGHLVGPKFVLPEEVGLRFQSSFQNLYQHAIEKLLQFYQQQEHLSGAEQELRRKAQAFAEYMRNIGNKRYTFGDSMYVDAIILQHTSDLHSTSKEESRDSLFFRIVSAGASMVELRDCNTDGVCDSGRVLNGPVFDCEQGLEFQPMFQNKYQEILSLLLDAND